MKADLLIKNANVYNTYFKKFEANDIIVKNGKFLFIGKDYPADTEFAEVIDADNMYAVPGLIDCHMHVESSMSIPSAFSRAVVKHGVTTIISEPHEVANVFGVEGIKALCDDIKGCAVDIRIAIPSSVPSTNSDLETTGGEINAEDLDELFKLDKTICLGEVMNCQSLINEENSKTEQIINKVKKERPFYSIEGHCPSYNHWELSQILYKGVNSDHTDQTLEGMAMAIKNGMFIQLQDKTILPEFLNYLKENNLWDRFSLVTDDTMPNDLIKYGHLDNLVKKAMHNGLTPEEAIYVASCTPACRMRLYDKGCIAPGKIADFSLLDDLNSFSIKKVFTNGNQVYDAADKDKEEPRSVFPEHFYHSVHVPQQKKEDFVITVPQAEGVVKCRVLMVKDRTTFIEQKIAQLPVHDHKVDWENSPYNLAVVIERYGKGGGRGYALVGGNALKKGAAATTYSHDNHNLIVIGQNSRDMTIAANKVIESQGGYCVAHEGETVGFAALPVAGILSDKPMEELGREIETVDSSLRTLGYHHQHIIMSLSTLSLPVCPYYKITDKGIIDVKNQCVIPLIIDDNE